MTIHLQTALCRASNFFEIAPIVKNAKEDISFFGGRYIYAEGYEGTVDIDAIAARFMELQETHFEPTEEERKLGREITPLISKLYESNYSRDKNILTRIFCAFRDFLRNVWILFCARGYGTRGSWSIDDGDIKFFDAYTSSQYQEVFGTPPPTGFMPHWARSGCPDRWYPPGYFNRVRLSDPV
ncbi:hypothetical protein [Estrella lausannensis]|uniref:Uncharacterized protein n=1 Tax=Estrella lausannensis TaxID=483423 RepID=A0A0H5DN29_9BACT|nr:hypothetical protein [Estrella lausannensis]CRX37631.1 conserved hypothetical protein [Estrella lausannensis]